MKKSMIENSWAYKEVDKHYFNQLKSYGDDFASDLSQSRTFKKGLIYFGLITGLIVGHVLVYIFILTKQSDLAGSLHKVLDVHFEC